MSGSVAFFWFRRDLRLNDNAGLYHALRSGLPVQCIFIFDTTILDKLEDKSDRRVVFIHRQLERLNKELHALGATLLTKHGNPLDTWKDVTKHFPVRAVYTNHDYEPYARERDEQLNDFFQAKKITFHSFKDQVIFEKEEIVKDDGNPYTVFTPYMKKWRAKINASYRKPYPSEKYFSAFVKTYPLPVISLKEIGFSDTPFDFPKAEIQDTVLEQYAENRNIPGIRGTSQLSVHLRFGTMSIRELVNKAWALSDTWINELIWREFYMMILWHFPHVVHSAFKPQYNKLQWDTNEENFTLWCKGETGYPIVDAGMRELNETGFMHNRVRMITAAFLTKYLLIDWRWGEAYFAEKLLDFELSSNNGNWQWSAGTGCDAAPYFRIFNMEEQTKKFDPDFSYIKKWIPEFQTSAYPEPIIDYPFARKRCLAFYKQGLITTLPL